MCACMPACPLFSQKNPSDEKQINYLKRDKKEKKKVYEKITFFLFVKNVNGFSLNTQKEKRKIKWDLNLINNKIKNVKHVRSFEQCRICETPNCIPQACKLYRVSQES